MERGKHTIIVKQIGFRMSSNMLVFIETLLYTLIFNQNYTNFRANSMELYQQYDFTISSIEFFGSHLDWFIVNMFYNLQEIAFYSCLHSTTNRTIINHHLLVCVCVCVFINCSTFAKNCLEVLHLYKAQCYVYRDKRFKWHLFSDFTQNVFNYDLNHNNNCVAFAVLFSIFCIDPFT